MNISRQIIVKDETFILPIQIDDMDLLDRPEIIYLDSETIKAIFEELDREIILTCKTKIWINRDLPEDKQYKPTDREKPYIVEVLR